MEAAAGDGSGTIGGVVASRVVMSSWKWPLLSRSDDAGEDLLCVGVTAHEAGCVLAAMSAPHLQFFEEVK